MPGAGNFLMSCNSRKLQIYIVSHKTEYGHFDPENFSLREEAVKWMEKMRFFESSYFGLNKKDIFFADTREEKVNIISRLNCDWFIDDLPEVFDENNFPKSTSKILFGFYNSNFYKNRTILTNWSDIFKKIFNHQMSNDIIFWVKEMTDNSIDSVERISGRGNSSIYKINDIRGKSYALKHYPDLLLDERPRLKTEFSVLSLLRKHGFKNVPKPIEMNDDLNLGLYEWVDGEKVLQPLDSDLNEAISFIVKLVNVSKNFLKSKELVAASEACLSAHVLVNQVDRRLSELQRLSLDSEALSVFLEKKLTPIWEQVKDKSVLLWPEESRISNLAIGKQILSPSDYGFHNCLKLSDGSLKFLDFDYFGWDDPVKLVADFIWHPAMSLNSEMKKKWKFAMLKLFSNDIYFEERLKAAMPLYGIRWALIILNEFRPHLAQKRKAAANSKEYDIGKSQKAQLIKADYYCNQVESMISNIAYN